MLIDWNTLPEGRGARPGTSRKSVSGEKLSAMLVEAGADAVFDGRLHHHPHEQMVLVIAGRASVQVDDRVVSAGPGELVFLPSHCRHAVVGVGPEGARFYEISAPARPDLLPGWVGPSALQY